MTYLFRVLQHVEEIRTVSVYEVANSIGVTEGSVNKELDRVRKRYPALKIRGSRSTKDKFAPYHRMYKDRIKREKRAAARAAATEAEVARDIAADRNARNTPAAETKKSVKGSNKSGGKAVAREDEDGEDDVEMGMSHFLKL